MSKVWHCWLILFFLIVVQFGQENAEAQLDEIGFRPPIPTYFVDPNLMKITLARFRTCGVHFVDGNRTIFALEELAFLSTKSASEYFRGHELLAYHFYVENRQNNPHYREFINDAELEYIPIVPLAWRTGKSGCSYSSFITMMLKMHEYLNVRDAQVLEAEPSMILPRRFFVASSFNMRTQWGSGMPTPYRRGSAWESMSAFIQTLSVGHYERWPECPDLLRKWWKYVVELPFLSINSVRQLNEMSLFPKSYDATLNYTYLTEVTKRHKEKHEIYKATPALPLGPVPLQWQDPEDQKWFAILNQPDDKGAQTTSNDKKQYTFFFAGHFELPGPELVCSTRNNILNLHYERSDLLLFNISNVVSYRKGVVPVLSEYMSRSVFCLITPGDSYASSLFYHAVANGCIPIVINDWFVFAFPWLMQYESFVLRIAENDFNLNPSYVFDTIKEHYLRPNPYLLRSMQRMMNYLARYLSWTKSQYMTEDYYDLLSADIHYFTRNNRFGLLDTLEGEGNEEKLSTYLPLELLMLELRYESLQNNYYQNVPCSRPLWCSHDYQSNASWLLKLPNPWAAPPSISISSEQEVPIEDDSKVPRKSHLSASSFPANIKLLAFQMSVLRKTFERYRGMPWAIFPTSPSEDATFARKEMGWWVQESDYFQVHALYIPPPSAVFSVLSSLNSNSYNGVPDLYYQVNRHGQRQIGTLSTSIPDRRSYLCQNRPRLIGIYKIVYFMQCVRVLWTLNPGKFKPKDNVQRFVSQTVPQIDQSTDNNDLSREEYDFIMAFHNITRHPYPNWEKENYPLAFKHQSYYAFNRSEEVRVKAMHQSAQVHGRYQLNAVYSYFDLN